MSFEALIEKVKQAEGALEARERQGEADWRQFKATWREAWTPGRIVFAGVVSGFLLGRAQPAKHVNAASALRLFSAVSSLFAVSRADDTADQAHDAAETAHEATEAPPVAPVPSWQAQAASASAAHQDTV